MSLVQFAHNKDAVGFQNALHERLEAKVNVALDEVKIEVASKLLGEAPTGLDNSSEGGESTMAAGGENGKNRLPDTTDIKSSAGNTPPGGTKLAHISVRPGTKLAVNPRLPGSANEETLSEKKWLQGAVHPSKKGMFDGVSLETMEKELAHLKKSGPHPENSEEATREHELTFGIRAKKGHGFHESVEPTQPHEQREGSKSKRALRMAMKKKYDKRQRDESVFLPQIDEKVIQAGSVDHMAHAVHACATGHCQAVSHRGTFTHFDHPHYAIHKDHGGIDPDKAEHHYYVAGAGGLHQFSVHHGSKGVDVKHVKKVSE